MLTKIKGSVFDSGDNGLAINVKDFGAVGDGSTDDTGAIQAAINYAANNGNVKIHAPEGHYKYTRLYGYYDASLNAGYPTGVAVKGIQLYGAGSMTRQNYKQDLYVGTVLESTETTGNCFNVADGTNSTNGVTIKDCSFLGATTGKLVNIDYTAAYTNVQDIFIGNNDVAGTALYITNVWISFFKNIDIIGQKDLSAAASLYKAGSKGLVYGDSGGGNVLWINVTGAYHEDGLTFGTDYNVSNLKSKNHALIGCQGQYCDNGLVLKHGVTLYRISEYWGEHNENSDIIITDSAENILIENSNLTSTDAGLEGSLVVGANTGTATTDYAEHVLVNKTKFDFCIVAGLTKYDSAVDVTIQNSAFKNNGGVACLIENTEPAELTLINNDYYPASASSEIIVSQRVRSASGDRAYLCHRVDYTQAASVSTDLDMSMWNKLPEFLVVTTTGGTVTLTLPTTKQGQEQMDMTVLKSFVANNITLDSGSGNVIAPDNTQTINMTATAGTTITIKPCAGQFEWTYISNA